MQTKMGYSPLAQINESLDFDESGNLQRRNVLINIREDSVEAAYQQYMELRRRTKCFFNFPTHFRGFCHHAGRPNAIQAIQKLLGHAQIQTTMRYAHLADSKLKDTVALLDSPEKASVFFGQPVGNQSEELLEKRK